MTASCSIIRAPSAVASSAVPSLEFASTTSVSSSRPAARSGATVSPSTPAIVEPHPLVGITTDTDVDPLSSWSSSIGKSAAAYRRRSLQLDTARSSERPRRARPSTRADVRTTTSAACSTGIRVAAQPGEERLVLERGRWLEAADQSVGLDGDAERGSGEMMMSSLRFEPRELRHPAPGICLSASQHAAGKPCGLFLVELDQAGDHARAPRATWSSCRASQSGAGMESASVVATRPASWPSDASRVGGGVHPQSSRRTRAAALPGEELESQPETLGGTFRHGRGVVGARVRDDDHLERPVGDRLTGERSKASRDRLLLVAGGNDDDAHQFHGAPFAITLSPVRSRRPPRGSGRRRACPLCRTRP